MRVLLFTGKGGVGKTTAAAATAALAARRGHKTLVLSTDRAHSLADAIDAPLSAVPTEIEPGLFGVQVDAQARFEATWSGVQAWLTGLFARGGADSLLAEELAVLPGADELMALLEVRDQVAGGQFDVVVVDCAPTAETLRLLALPQALGWYVERVFPTHRRVVRTIRPVLHGLGATEGMPDDAVFEAAARLHADLAQVQALLTDPATTSVRLVLTPESVVVAEARRTYTALALYGYPVDAVVANRIVPDGDDPWRAGWAASQTRQLERVEESFAGLPVHRAPYRATEPIGLPALTEVGEELYGDTDPLAFSAPAETSTVYADGDDYVLSMPLPLAEAGDLDLARSGDELILTVAGRRRLVALPSGLRRCAVAGAGLTDGTLRVRFHPDPQVWPT